MPFIKPSTSKFTFNLNGYEPISVVVNHAKDGRLIPIFLYYENHDVSLLKIKIETIKFRRDYPGYMLFCCLIDNYGTLQQIYLLFNINSCRWYVKP